MYSTKILSLIIPVYNEEHTLKTIVDKVVENLNPKISLELIIVDDCSTDNSYKIATKIKKENTVIKIYKHDINKGKGAAIHTGIMHATGDYIGIQDADLEYNPAEYIKLIEVLEKNDADVVYGSRFIKLNENKINSFWHIMINKFLTFVSNCFTDLSITDMETCYKLFKREFIQSITPKLKEQRFGFEPEVTQYVANNTKKIYECAISYFPRNYDEGKKINWKDGIRALYCIVKYGYSTAPLITKLIIIFALICFFYIIL